MAAYQFSKRLLILMLLLTLVATWIPSARAQTTSPIPAPVVPLRLPHESVAWSSPQTNADYVLTMKGTGFLPFSMRFDSLDARQICVFWTTSAPGQVIARAYAMASGGHLLAQSYPVPAYSPQTLDLETKERPSWTGTKLGTGWRSTPVVARDGNASCVTTTGHVTNNGPHDNTWLGTAVRSTNYGLVRAMMEIGVKYFNQRLLLTTYQAQHLQVTYQRRPSIAVVHYNLSTPVNQRFTMDVLQEPRVFRGAPYDFWTDPRGNENFSAAEQSLRWQTFMRADTINGGIAEAYAIALVTPSRKATSGVIALVEAAAKDEAIIRLTTPSDLTQLSAMTDPATRAKISEALMMPGSQVIVTQAPTTASTGWRGTPWIAWQRLTGSTIIHVGTYLGVLRGAAGEAGSNPNGMTHADADTSANTLATVAVALGVAGGYISKGQFGPTVAVIGHAAVALGVVFGVIAASLKVSIANTPTSPKTGHVDVDEGPSGTSVASGPGAGDAGGPAGSSPNGPAGEGPGTPGVGVGANGNSPSGGISGGGGEGEASEGDPGESN